MLFAYAGYEFVVKLVGEIIRLSTTCRDVTKMHQAIKEIINNCRSREAQILVRLIILKQWIIKTATTFEVVTTSPAKGDFWLKSDRFKMQIRLLDY